MKHISKLQCFFISIFIALFLFSAGMVTHLLLQSAQEQQAFDDLRSIVATESVPPAREETPTGEYNSPYIPLKEQNPDFYGWISIEGTKINYPVMYTPEDPEYYLKRAFDRSESQSGVPFLDAACTETGGNYLIYGHNMKNGSMFATLLSYKDSNFAEEHPTIQFDTLTESGTYTVIAAFFSEIYPTDSQNVFRYYQYAELNTPEKLDAYIKNIEAVALYPTGVTAEYGDQLLTLSTCSYHTANGRFVVVAKKEAD